MSGLIPEIGPSAIETMLTFGLGIVQAHATLLSWLAGILLVIFVFTYLISLVNHP